MHDAIDGRGMPPAGSAAEWRRGSIDGRGMPPAGSAAEWRRGSIDGRGMPPAGSAAEWRRGSIEQLAAGLWQVEADLPRLPIGRRMVIAKRADGDLVVHNAILCDDATMAQIESLGPVRWLIVPSGLHRMDLSGWTARYPGCSVIARTGATARIRERARVDGGPERLPADPVLAYVPLDGVPTEGVLVHRGRVTTLVFNDVVQNHPARLPGMVGTVLGILGSTGGAKVTWIARRFIVDDRRALADHLRRLATADVAMIVPGHGRVIREHASDVLCSIADTLHRG